MDTNIQSLIDISRKYGADPRYVIAGGGNTSYKDDTRLWVKASGHALATIGEDGFAVKGGAFDSKRTDCRTEARTESRKADAGYPNVTFRVIREDK